jgi:hypothetical protein
MYEHTQNTSLYDGSSLEKLQTFREVLLIMHRDTPAYHNIESGKYVVSNEDAGGTLIQPVKWSEAVRPGVHIGLSYILKYPGIHDGKGCPRCNSLRTTPGYNEGQRTWYGDLR